MTDRNPPSPPYPPRICLIGFMGSGKSTVGRLLAHRLGYRFLDLDEAIERQAERSVPEIFRAEGEEGFREREHRALRALTRRRRLVIAAGGGAPVPERNRGFFRNSAFTVYLDVSFEEFRRRIGRMGTDPSRPMLARPPDQVRALYEKRQPVYRQLGAPVRTDGRTPEQVLEQILELLGRTGLPARPP